MFLSIEEEKEVREWLFAGHEIVRNNDQLAFHPQYRRIQDLTEEVKTQQGFGRVENATRHAIANTLLNWLTPLPDGFQHGNGFVLKIIRQTMWLTLKQVSPSKFIGLDDLDDLFSHYEAALAEAQYYADRLVLSVDLVRNLALAAHDLRKALELTD